MSKSLGNLVMVRDLLEQWSPDALRLYLADHHYRSAWSYSEADLKAAQARAERLRAAAGATADSPEQDANSASARKRAQPIDASAARIAFDRAMDADLDAPGALKALEGLAARTLQATERDTSVDEARQVLRELASVLGLRLGSDPERHVVQGWNSHLIRFQGGSLT